VRHQTAKFDTRVPVGRLMSVTEIERHQHDDNLREATPAGCLLVLVSALTTLGLCIAVGGQFFGWVISLLPDESLMDYRAVKLVVGMVIYGALIAPGLLLYWIGEKLLAALGVRVWREQRKKPNG
jgi:uncharacterized membrane protein YdbT with pleckstrin-like domain